MAFQRWNISIFNYFVINQMPGLDGNKFGRKSRAQNKKPLKTDKYKKSQGECIDEVTKQIAEL